MNPEEKILFLDADGQPLHHGDFVTWAADHDAYADDFEFGEILLLICLDFKTGEAGVISDSFQEYSSKKVTICGTEYMVWTFAERRPCDRNPLIRKLELKGGE